SLLTATAWTTGASSFLLRLCLARLHGGCRLRGLSTWRTDPDFNEIAVAKATIEDCDSPRIDSALRHQIIRRASNQHIRLTGTAGTSGIDDNVSLRVRRVLQLNRQIIQTSLLIVERNYRKLIELFALRRSH